MAFDNTTRARLQRFVADARTLLTEDFSRQLQQTYGMDPVSGEVSELESLRHLDDQRLETAQLLREIFEHYLATETAKGKTAAKAVLDRILREQAFTILNRLAALRMMEARGILIEAIGKGTQSQAFQLYQRVANGALGETGEAYKHFLNSLFDLYSADLPALFDRFAPESRLFPREATLTRVLGSCRECCGNCRASPPGMVGMSRIRRLRQGRWVRVAGEGSPSHRPSASGSGLTPGAPRAASARSRVQAARSAS